MPCVTGSLTIDCQQVLNPLWSALCLQNNLQFAEYSFANNYLNRYLHDMQFVPENPPFVRGRFKDGLYHFIPTMPPEQFLKKYSEILREKNCSLFPLPEQWIEIVKSFGMQVTQNRDDADYLHHIEKMRTLAGRELSSRRNLLHQLQDQYEVTSMAIGPNEIEDAMNLLNEWQTHSSLPPEKNDYYATKEALENMKRLNLIGRIAFANNKPAGFSIGELLTPTTALIHFQKFRHDIKGITPFLFQDFAQHLPESVKWVNAEQDLGIPALRQAKTAYHPDLLLIKWRAHY